ncbi:MAG: hypothetical protein J6N15_02480 [Ruminiclostridium sp.]|nr:hypothetical protein [Ruminiclostridium sp.]
MSFRINKYTAEELKAMLPLIVWADVSVAAAALTAGFFLGSDWRLFTGLVVGNVLMLSNFVLLGFTVDKAVKCRDFRRARSISGISYGLRYAGMFAVLAALLTLDVINLVTAIIPLLYPKIYYTFFYALKRGKDE